MRQTYSGAITSLPENGIFVFGSNTQGRHGKGAALYAIKHFGAVYGRAKGLQGNSYAIITKDISRKPYTSFPKEKIVDQIRVLYSFALTNKELNFYVVYSGEGFNLNFYTPVEMAAMFGCTPIPDNIIFEEKFNELIQYL